MRDGSASQSTCSPGYLSFVPNSSSWGYNAMFGSLQAVVYKNTHDFFLSHRLIIVRKKDIRKYYVVHISVSQN